MFDFNNGLIDASLVGVGSQIPVTPSGGHDIWRRQIGDGLYQSRTTDGRTVILDEFGTILSIE